MSDLRFINVPKIASDILFEEMCENILKATGNYTNVNLHGRSGQKQDGIDVFARKDDGTWIGVQCKVRNTNRAFTREELLTEVNLAKNFNPAISEYYLYTTLDRDNVTQEYCREIHDELQREGMFSFEVKFWADIEAILKEEQYHPVYFKFYQDFFRDNTSIGHSIGKLMNLRLGFDGEFDTIYEIIFGKIPMFKSKIDQADYYRGTYFIVNLHDKKLEFITPGQPDKPPYCHETDIMDAFDNEIDCHRITKWINSIENLDTFIYNDEYTSEFCISKEERKAYFQKEEEN